MTTLEHLTLWLYFGTFWRDLPLIGLILWGGCCLSIMGWLELRGKRR